MYDEMFAVWALTSPCMGEVNPHAHIAIVFYELAGDEPVAVEAVLDFN